MTVPIRRRRRDTKRAKYAIAADPRLVADLELLVDVGIFRSRSHGFEEGLRLLLAKHRDEVVAAQAHHDAA